LGVTLYYFTKIDTKTQENTPLEKSILR